MPIMLHEHINIINEDELLFLLMNKINLIMVFHKVVEVILS